MPVKISISSYEGCMPTRSSQPQPHNWIKLSRNASLPFFFPILLRNGAGSLSSKRFQPLAESASRLAPIREAGTQCLVTFCRFPLVPLPLHCHEHHPCPPLSLHRMPFLLQAEDRTCQESEAGQPCQRCSLIRLVRIPPLAEDLGHCFCDILSGCIPPGGAANINSEAGLIQR